MLDEGKVSIESVTTIRASGRPWSVSDRGLYSSMGFENVDTKHVGRTWTMPEHRESGFDSRSIRLQCVNKAPRQMFSVEGHL